MTSSLDFHVIESLQDPIYDSWLDLYQKAFPLSEQMLVSWHNAALRNKGGDEHLLAALGRDEEFLGMARYDVYPESRAAVLWYMAVVPEARDRGIGSQLYQHIFSQIRAETGLRGLFFEVEDPGVAHDDEERRDSERRIRFYQRNGASILRGISYLQSVEWQPPITMLIMVHAPDSLDAEEAFGMAVEVFDGAPEKTGELRLESG